MTLDELDLADRMLRRNLARPGATNNGVQDYVTAIMTLDLDANPVRKSSHDAKDSQYWSTVPSPGLDTAYWVS